MKRIACPFCDYDVAVGNGSAQLASVTDRVLQHARQEHPGKGAWSPGPGVVIDMAAPLGVSVNETRKDLPEAPSTKLQSLMLTVSVRPGNRAVAYNLLGVTGHDLLLAGFDFSISANEYDPDEPLPPLPEDLRYDENTMFKVRNAILDAFVNEEEPVARPSVMTHEIINSLLNAGILFRERP